MPMCVMPSVGVVSFPDPFLLYMFCTCAVKRGRGERKRSGESAYPSTDPGRNVVVGDKYALVTTAAWLPCHLLRALIVAIVRSAATL